MVAQNVPEPENSKVIVFCERHTMLAEINTGQRRLSDVINDPMHKLFHLEQVRINPAIAWMKTSPSIPKSSSSARRFGL